jgi:plasmid maintenance system antidote protein VapI
VAKSKLSKPPKSAKSKASKASKPARKVHMGRVLAENLVRLGWAERIVRVRAQEICDRMEGGMVRQRINALIGAETIRPETLKRIADAIGVKAEELTRV